MPYKKTYTIYLLGALTILFGIMSYNRGMNADVNGDYYIYWQAGKHFTAGEKFYTPGLADGGFNYPPFAALFFSLFAVFPFHFSAFLYSLLINYGLWIVSFVLIRKIFSRFYPQENLILPIALSLLLSIAFYWHNYIWMNMNMLVLCCTLTGILYYQEKRFGLSYMFFMAGVFFKLTPIIFLTFAAIKRGPKDWPKMVLAALPFIILPIIFRGIHAGLTDWGDYYETFVAPFSKGKVDDNIISLGIPSLLNKFNISNPELGYPPLLHLSPGTLKLITLIIQITIFGALVYKICYDKLKWKNEAFSPADLSLIFLITLILPGRVWAHHHVCTGFIYTYLFIMLRQQKRATLLWVTVGLCFIVSILTRDVIGQLLAGIFMEYGYITWLMVYVGVLIVMFGYRKKEYVA